jgi:hypothetical protein
MSRILRPEDFEEQSRTRPPQYVEQRRRPSKPPERVESEDSDSDEIRDAAYETEIEQPDRDEGLITQIGKGIDYITSGDAVADASNALVSGVNSLIPEASPLKPITQSVDDFVLGSEEIQQAQEEQIRGYRERGQGLRAGVMSGLEGAAEGSQAGFLAPVTLAGRVANQATPWSDQPEVIRDSPIGSAVFNIAEVAVPSLIVAGVAPGLSTAPGFVFAEAGVETAVQTETNDDLIAGRTLARSIGEVASFLGYDGADLTRNLVKGESFESQAFTAVMGYLQNLGINVGVNQITSRIGKAMKPKPGVDAEEAARATGKSPEEVQASLDDTIPAPYRADAEPGEVLTADTAVATSKPDNYSADLDDAVAMSGDPEMVIARDRQNAGAAWDEFKQNAQTKGIDREAAAKANTAKAIADREKELADLKAKGGEDAQVKILERQIKMLREGKNPYGTTGNQFINSDALAAQALKANGFGADGLSPTNYRHFATLDRVASKEGMEKLLDEAAKAAGVFKNAPEDLARARNYATAWWRANKSAIVEGDFDAAALSFRGDRGLIRTLRNKEGVEELVEPGVDSYLRDFAETTPEGFLASALVGEEIGMKGIRLATIAGNYDSSGVDFTNIVNQFAEIVDKSELFRLPQLRGKRNWFVGGELQQKGQLKKAKDIDVVDPAKPKSNEPTLDSPGRDYTLIKRDADDPGASFGELWIRAQNGDAEALQSVKQYMRAVAASSPESAFKTITDLDTVLRNQLRKGTSEATQQLFYAAMLGRISTQVASAASSIARFVAEPLGALSSPLLAGGKTSDMMYGIGQLYGSFGALRSGLSAARRTFATETPLNAGLKLDGKVRSAAQRAQQMDGAMQAYRQQLNEKGVDPNSIERLTAEFEYNYQRWSNTAFNRNGERMLQSQDEGFKVAFASQVASGRAFQRAFEEKNWKNLDKLVAEELDKIFKHGVDNGKITDREVLESAKALTYQTDIPVDGNPVDKLFLGMSNLGQSGPITKFFFPFVRASYNMLEVAARYEPSGGLVRLIPRYQKILKGEMGEAARLQLQSQVAFGRLWTASSAMAAMTGMVTGYNVPDGTPRTSILIPANNEKGYIAVDYSRIEPFSSYLAVVSDLVNSAKTGAISEQDYERIAQELVFSIASASFDKTFTTGLNDLASLIDFKDADWKFYDTTTKLSTNVLSTPFGTAAALTRMVGSWTNPYQTIARDPNSWINTYFNSVRQRLTGGIGLPRLSDPFTGEEISYSPAPGENPIVVGLGAMLNEMGWPGRVRRGQQNPNVEMLGTLGFDISKGINMREYDDIALSPEMQRNFSRAIAIEGDLNNRLTIYFNSKEFKDERRIMESATRIQGTSSDGSAADAARQRINRRIRQAIQQARYAAASAVLMNDPEYQRLRQMSEVPLGVFQEAPSARDSNLERLINMNNGQLPNRNLP